MFAAAQWLVEHYGASIVAFTLFALLHSLGARESGKHWLTKYLGRFFVTYYWRLIYCALSLLALYTGISALHWESNPQHNLWLVDYPNWLWQGLLILHLGSIALIYIAFIQSDYLEFLGLKQAWAGIKQRASHQTASMNLFGSDRLEIHGIYAWLRHPMLSGGLLFLLTSGPSLNNMVYTVMYTAYMLIGGHYEDRRLLKIFGEDYRQYQQSVPAYIPRISRLSARHT